MIKHSDDIIDGVGNIVDVVEGVAAINSEVMNKLTRAQKRNIETLNNVVKNNLKDHDFSGTLRDL